MIIGSSPIIHTMPYRADIDGLRALAVLLVVIFHFELFSELRAGFIGVDIFFVISGFLITNIILWQLKQHSFSLGGFYLRRVKRLLPTFYLVIIATLLVAYAMFSPNNFEQLAHALRYSVTFHANHFFAKQTGYFAADSQQQPLLHVWSLNAEEQFYFIWPALLLCLAASSHRIKLLAITSLGILSLFISQYLLNIGSDHAYYSLPSRAFEMLFGALLAVHVKRLPKLSQYWVRPVQGVAILGLIALAFMLSESSPFPGIAALPVVFFTCLFLYAGSTSNSPTLMSDSISVGLGKMSYSLYLWHWPIWVFGSYAQAPSLLDKLAFLGLSLVLSFLTWKYFESPLRFKGSKKPSVVFCWYFAVPIIALFLTAKVIEHYEGYPSRLNQQASEIYRQTISESSSDLTTEEASVVIWGDSHGLHLQGVFDFLTQHGLSYRLATTGGCFPGLGIYRPDEDDDNCKQGNAKAFDLSSASSVSVVVLATRWANYLQDKKDAYGEPILLGSSEYPNHPVYEMLKRTTLDTVRKLQEQGKTVYIVSPYPDYPFNVATCLVNSTMLERSFEQCNLEAIEQEKRQSRGYKLIGEVLSALPKTRMLDLFSTLCDQDSCHSVFNDVAMYKDSNHLSYIGGYRLAEQLFAQRAFDGLMSDAISTYEEK